MNKLSLLGSLLLCSFALACTGQASEPGAIGAGQAASTAVGATSAAGEPVAIINDCATDAGYEVSTYRGATRGGVEVHVLGVYETRSDHTGARYHPRGSATVHVSRQGHHVLVLTSYEPTHFTVTAAPGAVVDRVILAGYNRHTATVVSGAVVEDQSGESSAYGACAYAWPSDDQGCDTHAVVAAAERELGTAITSFAGCYRATSFEIADDRAVQPPARPAPPAPCGPPVTELSPR